MELAAHECAVGGTQHRGINSAMQLAAGEAGVMCLRYFARAR
jgi:hypothetical protein